MAVLIGAVLVCFGRTLGSYFLADDFGEVAYVSRIAEGDWARLWSNFTGNYMQVPSMAVYRPWLLITLLFDYAAWKTNAAGYYFTNLAHYLACAVLIFALIKLLTSYWGKLRSNLAATFSGLLFVTHPLHCESVSWVVGRVDIVCLTYYLLGLVSVALYLRDSNKRWLVLTFVSFWLGILTKEMAIALPVTATALAFLWGNSQKHSDGSEATPKKSVKSGNDLNFDPSVSIPPPPQHQPQFTEPSRASAIAALQKLDQELDPHAIPATALNDGGLVTTSEASSTTSQFSPQDLRERIAVALPVGVMLFACTVVYFIIRYAALGTITGGYTGSIGSSQFSGILQKWSDFDTVLRIVFPLNQFVFGEGTAQKNLLSGLYLVLIALTTTRLVIGNLPRRWLVFLFISSLTALAPIYQLWGIGYELEGSRFVFFLTVSLAMLFPIILFSPTEKVAPRSNSNTKAETVSDRQAPAVSKTAKQTNIRLLALSIVALASLTLVFAKLTMRNNIPWVHAGKQTESIHEKAAALSKSTPAGKQVGVVGIPKDEGGAHMILNGTTFRQLLTPPFAESGLTGKILTFEPSLFGDADKIDTAHFKEALVKPNVAAFLVWNMDKKDFEPFRPGAPEEIPKPIYIPLMDLKQSSANPANGKPSLALTSPIASYPYTQGRGDRSLNGFIENADRGLGIRISGLNVHPAQFDYIVVRARTAAEKLPADAEKNIFKTDTCLVQLESGTNQKTALNVRFQATTARSADAKDASITVRLPLSAYWRFFLAGEIANIVVDLPSVNNLKIEGIELMPAALIAPTMTVLERNSADDGAFNVDRRRQPGSNSAPVRISVEASKLKEAVAVEMQILQKNFFFDNLKSEAALKSGTQTVLQAPGNSATFVIPDKVVDSNGYVQLRVRCLDKNNQQVGEYSFPITLRVMSK